MLEGIGAGGGSVAVTKASLGMQRAERGWGMEARAGGDSQRGIAEIAKRVSARKCLLG